jgi:hypothetical protein
VKSPSTRARASGYAHGFTDALSPAVAGAAPLLPWLPGPLAEQRWKPRAAAIAIEREAAADLEVVFRRQPGQGDGRGRMARPHAPRAGWRPGQAGSGGADWGEVRAT